MWIRNKLPGMECTIFDTSKIITFDTMLDEDTKKHCLVVGLNLDGTAVAVRVAEGNFSDVNQKLDKLLKYMSIDIRDL